MSDANPSETPEVVGKILESKVLLNQTIFKELVGALLYISLGTRPDITHALGRASRTPMATEAHFTALKRILRYLKGTQDLQLCFKRSDELKLQANADANSRLARVQLVFLLP